LLGQETSKVEMVKQVVVVTEQQVVVDLQWLLALTVLQLRQVLLEETVPMVLMLVHILELGLVKADTLVVAVAVAP
jgi:hypothetical protein